MVRLNRPARGRITQGFTAVHRGLDFGWGLGKRVKAAAGGYARLEYDSGYGLRIFLEHGGGHETEYSHLAGRTVRNRQWVGAGSKIGTMGNSGTFARFVHLHFAHWVNGVRIRPVFGTTIPAAETITPITPTEETDDMKFLSHNSQDIWYLAGEFTVTRTRDLATAREWKQAYGDSKPCSSAALKSLIEVAETNAATRDAQTAAAIKGAVTGTIAPTVIDYARIKKNTAELLAGIPDAVADELHDRTAS